MATITITNAAHTLIRRSIVRDLGVWPNLWSRRVPGTTFWLVEFSDEALLDILSYRQKGESFSDTLIFMFTTVEKHRRRNASSLRQPQS
jgi:hypothetical protein